MAFSLIVGDLEALCRDMAPSVVAGMEGYATRSGDLILVNSNSL